MRITRKSGTSDVEVQRIIDAGEQSGLVVRDDDIRGVAPTSAEYEATPNDIVQVKLSDGTCEYWQADENGEFPTTATLTIDVAETLFSDEASTLITDWDEALDAGKYYKNGGTGNTPPGFNNFERGLVWDFKLGAGATDFITMQKVYDGGSGAMAVRRFHGPSAAWSEWTVYDSAPKTSWAKSLLFVEGAHQGVVANPTPHEFTETFTPDAVGAYILKYSGDASGTAWYSIGTTAGGADVAPITDAAGRLTPEVSEREYLLEITEDLVGIELHITVGAGGGGTITDPQISIRSVSAILKEAPKGDTVSITQEDSGQLAVSVFDWQDGVDIRGNRFKVTDDPASTVGITEVTVEDGATKSLYLIGPALTPTGALWGGQFNVGTQIDVTNTGGVFSYQVGPRQFSASGGQSITSYLDFSFDQLTQAASSVDTVDFDYLFTPKDAVDVNRARYELTADSSNGQAAGDDDFPFGEGKQTHYSRLVADNGNNTYTVKTGLYPVRIVADTKTISGTGNATRVSYIHEVGTPTGTRIAGATDGRFGNAQPNIQAVAVIPPDTTITVDVRSTASSGSQRLIAGASIDFIEQIHPVSNTIIQNDLGAVTAAANVDFTASRHAKVTLGASVSITFTPPADIGMVYLLVQQDTAGNHSPAWPPFNGPVPTIDPAPNAKTVVGLYFDGTEFHTG